MTNIDKAYLPPKEEVQEIEKDLLKMSGWPNWPPTETPPDSEWWKRELSDLPTTKSIRIPETVAIFEINGSATAGKSTIENELIKTIEGKLVKEKMAHINVLNVVDPTITTPNIVQDLTFTLLNEDDNDPLPFLQEKDDWTTSIELQLNKLLWWSKVLNNPIEFFGSDRPTIVIANRGPTDALVWEYTLLTHHGDLNFEIPEMFKKNILQHSITVAANLQVLSAQTNAKIFTGTSQEEAQKRRQLVGKQHSGWVTDSPIFKDYSSWTNYWINSVYPRLRQIHGSGLLTLDGQNSSEAKIGKISDYIVESAKRALLDH